MTLRRTQVWFGNRVDWQCDRPVRCSLAQGGISVGEIEDSKIVPAIGTVYKLGLRAGLTDAIQDYVGAHCGSKNDKTARRVMWRDGLAVERDDARCMVPEIEREDPGIRGVDQAEADPLP